MIVDGELGRRVLQYARLWTGHLARWRGGVRRGGLGPIVREMACVASQCVAASLVIHAQYGTV